MDIRKMKKAVFIIFAGCILLINGSYAILFQGMLLENGVPLADRQLSVKLSKTSNGAIYTNRAATTDRYGYFYSEPWVYSNDPVWYEIELSGTGRMGDRKMLPAHP